MILHWLLNIVFATHCCLSESFSSQDLELCSSTGELPAPELFHNAGSVHPGDTVSLLCVLPSNNSITRFFFCKEKALVSAQKPKSSMAVYKFNISQTSSEQYSCGYQHKEGLNQQKKSVLSLSWNLTAPPEDNFHSCPPCEHDEINGIASFIGEKSWITLGALSFVILILAALTYHLVRKDGNLVGLHQTEDHHSRTQNFQFMQPLLECKKIFILGFQKRHM
ncbi:uncharacterized protein LOC134495513 isoform X2 [Candoia aspera]|uniref:uncharacterized protein LOC134495513 isoform X2 n=1 Tax=Candoia aspera TaxID=51853 RepID=UPI002FD7BD56